MDLLRLLLQCTCLAGKAHLQAAIQCVQHPEGLPWLQVSCGAGGSVLQAAGGQALLQRRCLPQRLLLDSQQQVQGCTLLQAWLQSSACLMCCVGSSRYRTSSCSQASCEGQRDRKGLHQWTQCRCLPERKLLYLHVPA